MFKNLSIGKTIGVGFACVLVLVTISTVVSLYNMNRLMGEVGHSSASNELLADVSRGQMDNLKWVKTLNEIFVGSDAAQKDLEINDHGCDFGKWYYSQERLDAVENDEEFAPLLARLEMPHRELHESARAIQAALASGNAEGARGIYLERTLPALQSLMEVFDEVNELAAEQRAFDEGGMYRTARGNFWWLLCMSILSGAVAIGMCWAIVRNIVGTLSLLVDGLSSGADQVAAASHQVANASQEMAEGASEQASSLEQTSASLAQLSTSTQGNAESAREANRVAGEVRSSTETCQEAMSRMDGAIVQIKTAADQTAKIVHTINDMAFQTNLLSLNAAVEAAHAGDAGKGFAVVAEEIRNLAQRSAEAASETAALIQDSQHSADNGVRVCEEVGSVLEGIVTRTGKMTALMSDVTTASNEQAQGVVEINNAVTQIDHLTQSNAANAEETASASEELSAQAKELNELVNTLIRILQGERGKLETEGTVIKGKASEQARSSMSIQTHRIQRASRPISDEFIPLEDEELIEI